MRFLIGVCADEVVDTKMTELRYLFVIFLSLTIDNRVEGKGLETGRCDSHLFYGAIC